MKQPAGVGAAIRAMRAEIRAEGGKPGTNHPKLRPLYEKRWAQKAARLARRKAKVRKQKKAGFQVTRSVSYTYNEADNSRLQAFYHTEEWRLMRYEALKRDGARCGCCGRTPREHGIVVNVDHIKPLRVFWDLRLELANLQVLCGDCNEGKGARHADDWRANA